MIHQKFGRSTKVWRGFIAEALLAVRKELIEADRPDWAVPILLGVLFISLFYQKFITASRCDCPER